MFISQINPSFTFNDKTWLVSIANSTDKSADIPSAILLIEGVLMHRLLFCRYEIQASRCSPNGDTNENQLQGHLSRIGYIESHRYQGILQLKPSISYPANLKVCDSLSRELKQIARLLNDNGMGSDTNFSRILVRKSCINYCFDLLAKHGISYQENTLTTKSEVV